MNGQNKTFVLSRMAVSFLIVMAFCIGFVNCGGKKPSGPAPDWLSEDAPLADDQYLYGSGCAQYQISNHIFKRRTASERARVELAKTIHEHARSELGTDAIAARRVVEATLPNREIVDTYQDEQGNFCARAGISRERIEGAVSIERNRNQGR
jgi:hypothetical protein